MDKILKFGTCELCSMNRDSSIYRTNTNWSILVTQVFVMYKEKLNMDNKKD